MGHFSHVFLAVAILGVTVSRAETRSAQQIFSSMQTDDALIQEVDDLEQILDRAEARASNEGRLVLQTGRAMIKNGTVVLGSCWDYINGVYNQAGFTTKKRVTAFKSKKAGPYANASDIEPGDWLYFINHSYGDIEHSGIFVEWLDFPNREALILSYPGMNIQAPGRYKSYDLSNPYNIIRGKQGSVVAESNAVDAVFTHLDGGSR